MLKDRLAAQRHEAAPEGRDDDVGTPRLPSFFRLLDGKSKRHARERAEPDRQPLSRLVIDHSELEQDRCQG